VLLGFYSLPDFWFATIMLAAFASWLHWFPVGGVVNPVTHEYLSAWGALIDRLRHLVLPATTLTLLMAAAVARYQRSAMLDVLPSEFIQVARAKGVSERRVVWHHALRSALTPVITLTGLLLPALVGGSVFVETIFTWPGMGLLTTDAISNRDYDLLAAAVLVGAVLVAAGNLLADLLHGIVDPRLPAE
jgi:peptide/nickel transport system permease protein